MAVVGGGAIGASVAFELTRRGASVVLLEEAAEVGCGCSAGSAGLICPSHSTPLATPRAFVDALAWIVRRDAPLYLHPSPTLLPWLLRFAAAARRSRHGLPLATRTLRELSARSLELHAQLAADGIATGFQQRGILNVYETDAGFAWGRHEAKGNAAAAHVSSVLDTAGVRDLEPAVGPTIRGGVFYPKDAHCDSQRFVRSVALAAEEAGAEVCRASRVTEVLRAGSRVTRVLTTRGEVRPTTVVLAAGVHSRHLARSLGLSLPLARAKGYHVDLQPDEAGPRLPVYIHEARVVATPITDRLRLAGIIELGCNDLSVSSGRAEAIVHSVARVLPSVHKEHVASVWSGFRPLTPDGLPVVGRAANPDNVVVATGHGTLGLTLAPITGKIVADLITTGETDLDIRLLSPDRFSRIGGRGCRPSQSPTLVARP